MLKNRGLATHLIVFILTSTTIIFAGVIAYNHYASKKAVMAEVTENARNLTLSTAYKIEAILRGIEKVPHNLAGIIEKYPDDQNDLIWLINNALENNPEVFGAAIAFDPYAFNPDDLYFSPYGYRESDLIKFTYLGGESYQYFYWDWYQIPKELNVPIWTEPYYDEGGGNIIMSTFSVPFYKKMNGKNHFQGIVTSDVSLMWLKDIVSAVRIYQTGYAFLISQNGVFITHPEKGLIMKESIFSIAESNNDLRLRRIGQDMIKGGEGFAPLLSFTTGKKSWMYYAPLPSTHWSIGVVILEDELFAGVRELSTKIFLIGITGLISLGLIITWLSKTITRPLRILDKGTSSIAKGDFSVSVEETGPKEVARLGHAFNQLGQQLTEYIEKRDFIRDTFGRYLTQEVVNKLLESQNGLELGGERRKVTIMMTDLRGFTALSERLDPEQVVQMLNTYFEFMVDVVLEYKGTINEIIGDALLIIFGAPQEMPDRAQRAIACAIEMQNAMKEVNKQNRSQGLPDLEMGIGLNEAEVIVGNIGSSKRSKYGVVGSGVNMTSRIESYTVGGQILISESVRQEAGEILRIDEKREVIPKGAETPLIIYEIGGISGKYNLILEESELGLVDLIREIPFLYTVIGGKHIGKEKLEGKMVRLSKSGAEIALKDRIDLLTNLKVNLLDIDEELTAKNFYGKVVECLESKKTSYVLRFTSVPPEVSSYFKAFMQLSKPSM